MASNPGGLILEALALIVLAPAAGVVMRSIRGLIGAILAATAVSLAVHILSSPGAPVTPTVLAHLLIAACGLALGGVGRMAAAWLEDPLDAMAVALCAALAMAGGLFAVGDIGIHLPTRLVNTALAISPLVAITSAGSIDVLRSGFLYDLSPIAHREFTYPSVTAAAAVHGSVAVCAFIASVAVAARRSRAAIPEPPL